MQEYAFSFIFHFVCVWYKCVCVRVRVRAHPASVHAWYKCVRVCTRQLLYKYSSLVDHFCCGGKSCVLKWIFKDIFLVMLVGSLLAQHISL